MRVLRVIPSLDPRWGGPMAAAGTLDSALIAMGHSVEVVCLDRAGEHYHADYPVRVHAIGPSYLGFRFNPRLVPWLRARRKNYDVVVVDGLWQFHGFGTWRALAGTDTPYVVFTHGMLSPWFKRAYRLKHLKKWLYWPWADYRLLRDARNVIFTCEDERIEARESFWLYKCNEVIASPGISEPTNEAASNADLFFSSFPELQGKRIILFLGRLHQVKGCDLLVRAFAQVASKDPLLHLVMAGPDEVNLGSRLRDLATSLGVSNRISWVGMLSGDMKWSAMRACEGLCLPSHHENFGMAVVEALACAKPVLISDKVKIWREIAADGAGLIQDDSVEGTVALLESWLSMSEPDALEMSRAARHCFLKRFQAESAANSIMHILCQEVDREVVEESS